MYNIAHLVLQEWLAWQLEFGSLGEGAPVIDNSMLAIYDSTLELRNTS